MGPLVISLLFVVPFNNNHFKNFVQLVFKHQQELGTMWSKINTIMNEIVCLQVPLGFCFPT